MLPSAPPRWRTLTRSTTPKFAEPLALLNLAWPNGLQEGYSQPVALLINEEGETEEMVNRLGYRYFTSIKDLQAYVEREILAGSNPASAGASL